MVERIVNGDFETGDFTGWSHEGLPTITEASAHSGTYGCFNDVNNFPPYQTMQRIRGIHQTINLTGVDDLEFYHSMTLRQALAGYLSVWISEGETLWTSSEGVHSYAYASIDVSSYSGNQSIEFGGLITTGPPGSYNLDYSYDDISAVGTSLIQINISDAWKEINTSGCKINIGDSWKDVVGVQQNIGDTWKTVF